MLLVESEGYSYTKKKQTASTMHWWCSVRNKRQRCPATVNQRGDEFRRGVHGHIHPADPGVLLNTQMSRKVKDTAAENVFKSAMDVVEDELHQVDPAAISLPRPDHLVRKANRFRQKLRPEDPRGMDFELAQDFLPEDFLKEDLTVDGARHLIFATTQQLDLLSRVKTWYVDATFKVLRTCDTFEQLFGIHAFLKKDGETKQVPLAFVFMSRRRKKDYKKVLKKVKRMFPTPPTVQKFVLDFEAATWKAIRSVFPGVTVTGCAFHWTQAVWKKVQALGLSVNYNGDAGTHKVIRRLLAMPLLPAEHITAAFNHQRGKAGDSGRMRDLFSYVENTWINGMWEPTDWSVYGQAVRTNNDCEGWHRRLNVKAATVPPFYVLVEMLHREAMLIPTQMKLVSEKKLKKAQRKKTRTMQANIIELWAAYAEGEMSTDKLLKKLSYVYGK